MKLGTRGRNEMENNFTLYFRLDELAALEKTVDVPIPPHVIWDNTENITLGGEGATYYEQYTIPGQKITYYLRLFLCAPKKNSRAPKLKKMET